MNLIIRQSIPEDLEAISKIEKQVFTDAWSDESLLSEIENPQFVCLSALLADEYPDSERVLAAYLMALAIPGIEVQLCNIAVDPDKRRLGIASALLQVLLDVAAEIKAEEVTLEVRVSNIPARNLYRSFGFEETGLRRGYYEDGEDAVLMSYSCLKDR